MKGKYRPELTIDMKKVEKENELYSKFYNETKGYSITPTTFQGRSLKTLDAPIFEEVYKPEHGKNSVTRFGLNVSSEWVKDEVLVKNNKGLEEKSFKAPSIATSVKENKEKELLSYKEQAKQLLTKAEEIAVDQAIKYSQTHKTKTVLVDIFDRNDNQIKLKDDNVTPKIHTVVLYEQKGKYLVIDPNSTKFSTFLVGASEDIISCFKETQIYKRNGEAGSKPNEWRDCIDIAVKLAFNLNFNEQGIELIKQGYLECIDHNSLKNNRSIQEVSNNPDTYKKVPDELKHYPFRVKQSSNIIEQKKTTEALKILGVLSKKVTTLIETNDLKYAGKKLQQQKEDMFQNPYSPDAYDKAIESICDCCEQLSKVDEVSLLAESMNVIESTFNEV